MKWRKAFEKGRIIERLNKIRTVSGSKVSFDGAEHQDTVSILMSAIDFSDNSTWAYREAVIRNVLFSPTLPEGFSERQFRESYWQARAKLDGGRRSYKAVFVVCNCGFFGSRTFRVGDATVKFGASEHTPFLRKAKAGREILAGELEIAEASGGLVNPSYVTVSCSGVDQNDAMELAVSAVKCLLGLANFFVNSGKVSRLSLGGGRRRAVSEIVIFPQMTIHETSGDLAASTIWYDPYEAPLDNSVKSMGRKDWFDRNISKVWGNLDHLPWSEKVPDLLERYYDAFADPSLERSFLEGWRVLELIAGADGVSSKEMVNRASFLYSRETEMDLLGRHLLLRRNHLSHGNRIGVNDEDTLAHQLNRFMMPLLFQYLTNPLKFSAEEDLLEFLSCSSDTAELKERAGALEREMKLIRQATSFRSR